MIKIFVEEQLHVRSDQIIIHCFSHLITQQVLFIPRVTPRVCQQQTTMSSVLVKRNESVLLLLALDRWALDPDHGCS